MEIKYSKVCDIGKCRLENQDSLCAQSGDGWGLFVVADGMGGHSDGLRASRKITEIFKKWVLDSSAGFGNHDISYFFSELRRQMEKANDEILQATEDGEICGSTAVVLLIVHDSYALMSIGDSRCYELQRKLGKKRLVQMTCDEICRTPGKKYGKLMNAVGTRQPLRCSISSGKIKKRHLFFLCTDGVYKFCDEQELTDIFKHNIDGKLETAVRKIIDLTYQNGAKDNFSAIIVSVRL